MVSQIVLVDTHGYEGWKSRLHRKFNHLRMVISSRLDGPFFIQKQALIHGIPEKKVSELQDCHLTSSVLWFQDSGFLSIDLTTWVSLVKNRDLLIGPNFDLSDNRISEYMKHSRNYKYLFPSNWVRNIALERYEVPPDNCAIWPIGVEVKPQDNLLQDRNKLLIYNKFQDEILRSNLSVISDFCRKNNLELKVFTYGNYRHSDFKRALKDTAFVVWFGITESQSIAQFEIWAEDVPTLVLSQDHLLYNGLKHFASSSPYLSEETGEFFSSSNFSMETLEEFHAKLKKMTPQSWVRRHAEVGESFVILQNLYDTC